MSSYEENIKKIKMIKKKEKKERKKKWDGKMIIWRAVSSQRNNCLKLQPYIPSCEGELVSRPWNMLWTDNNSVTKKWTKCEVLILWFYPAYIFRAECRIKNIEKERN